MSERPADSSAARTANDIWCERVKAFQNRCAFHFSKGENWETLTWGEADIAAREIGAGLLSLGLAPGERVAILAQTRLEWLLVDVAISLGGLVSVPLYPSLAPKECAFVLRDSQARVVVAENQEQLDKLAGVLAEGSPITVILMDGPEGESSDRKGQAVPTLKDIRRLGRENANDSLVQLQKRYERVGSEDLFTIIYTSGTTGQPKGVELTHKNLVSSCASAVRAFDLRPTDVQYLFLPLAHVLGRELEWAPIIVGAEVAFTTGLHRIKFDLTEIRPTFMAGVPRIFEKLHAAVLAGAEKGSAPKRALVSWAFSVGMRYAQQLREKKTPPLGLRLAHPLANKLVLKKLQKKLGLDRCRFLISGGAALSAEIAAFFHGVGLLILEGYGLTETTAAAFVNRLDCFSFGTVGPAIDVIEYRIAADGEILVRGPSVFSRYHGNPQATAEVISPDGWFHTGDMGELDHGFLRIVDRKKDILVTTNGKNIAPQKLENALKAHCRHVGQVVVFGDNRPYCVALITPSEPAVREFGQGNLAAAAASPELREVIGKAILEVNGSLASYETMKSFVIVPHEFSEADGELTPSLKIKRAVVAERFADAILGMYKN